MNNSRPIIWLMVGFLIVYHTVKIYTAWNQSGASFNMLSDGYFQFPVRLWIIFSLILVMMNKRIGIISMWLSITTLVTIQYILIPVGSNLSVYYAPLKGFIFPSIISWLFWRQQKAQQQNPD
jgi:hypothetical protein